MLTEFAFTPSIFDENAHQDKEQWREQLKELGRNMFPRVSAWPAIVSDLYGGSWYNVVEQSVKAINDQKARLLCEGILQNMRMILVHRPACGPWPESDLLWAHEAIESNKAEPIERIVTDDQTKSAMSEELPNLRSLSEVDEGGFWRGITSNNSPKMIMNEQVALLRKLCLHSNWISLINPHTSTSEFDFALSLLTSALNRPADYAPLEFELHMQEPQNVTDDADKRSRIHNMTTHLSRSIRPQLQVKQFVTLYYWPKILERRLIAGIYSKDSHGQKLKSPRWGVSMNHVARGNEPDLDPTNWNLLRKEEFDVWYRNYVADTAKSKPPAIVIKANP